MAKNEKTSKRVSTIAAKALKAKNKKDLTLKEIKTLAGTALTQAPDIKKKK